jgi:hypothetical protein
MDDDIPNSIPTRSSRPRQPTSSSSHTERQDPKVIRLAFLPLPQYPNGLEERTYKRPYCLGPRAA